jgi:hypothetical protein
MSHPRHVCQALHRSVDAIEKVLSSLKTIGGDEGRDFPDVAQSLRGSR